MKMKWLFLILAALVMTACAPSAPVRTGPKVIAVESFLADIAQQIAGDRMHIDTLVPVGLDPHAFEPTPRDVVRLTESDAIIINGAGFEEWLGSVLTDNLQSQQIIEAAAGLSAREPGLLEVGDINDQDHPVHEIDPHFWLDPTLVIRYAENIRDGFIQLDPSGNDTYMQNTAAYIAQLTELDQWIMSEVENIPAENRKIVTNHESFGYFADRYGFTIIGAIIPSVTTGASPSSRQLTHLVDQIRASGSKVIFLETGANSQLADQIAAETGVWVVQNLYTHSITGSDGDAPSYLEMMRWNTRQIVKALE